MKEGRHFTASVFIVFQGSVLLHRHKKFDLLLPVGGYLEKGELPHQAAIREAREEAGLEIDIIHSPLSSNNRLEELPMGEHLNLIYAAPGVEQVDFTFYASTRSNQVQAEEGKTFAWYTQEELAELSVDDTTARYALEAINKASLK